MVPIFPHKPTHQRMNDSAHVPFRAAKEQEFYDHYGAESIIGFFRFIQAVSALPEAPIALFHRLFSERPRKHRVTLLRPGRQKLTHGLSEG